MLNALFLFEKSRIRAYKINFIFFAELRTVYTHTHNTLLQFIYFTYNSCIEDAHHAYHRCDKMQIQTGRLRKG